MGWGVAGKKEKKNEVYSTKSPQRRLTKGGTLNKASHMGTRPGQKWHPWGIIFICLDHYVKPQGR